MKIYIDGYVKGEESHRCAIEREKLEVLSYTYAHGKLERMAGYDILYVAKNNHFDKRKNINGQECIAILPSGEEADALFFYWKAYRVWKATLRTGETYRHVEVQPRGLLVAKNDAKAIKYAKEAFQRRERYL